MADFVTKQIKANPRWGREHPQKISYEVKVLPSHKQKLCSVDRRNVLVIFVQKCAGELLD